MGHFDINSLASVVTILLGMGAFGGFARRRAGKWVSSIDARFDAQAEETEKVRVEAAKTREEVAGRLDAIETQLQPNGGSTHHDRMAAAAAAAVREAVREEIEDGRGRPHRGRRWIDR